MDEKLFINTRTRFQRVSDAKFFSGWIKDFREGLVTVHVSSGHLELGEDFVFQVHAEHASAVFHGHLTGSGGDEHQFAVPEPLRLLSAQEEPRIIVSGMTGSVKGASAEMEMRLVDVSSRGAGIVIPSALTKGERVRLRVLGSAGQIECSAEVRYCRPDPQDPSQFRAGLLLGSMDRIERARWSKLLGKEIAA